MKKWTSLTQHERLEHIKYFDFLYMDLYNNAKQTTLSDEEFSIENKDHAFKLVELFSQYRQKPTYNNLTNCNFHFLVKVLNYNNFFKIPKDIKIALKERPLIS